MKLSVTTAGLDFLLKSLQGGPSPEFRKIVFGKGENAGNDASEMSIPVKEIDIYSITRKQDYVTLVGVLNNTEIAERFKATELGVYITDPEVPGGTILYAYGYVTEDEAALIPAATDYLIETEETIFVYVGAVDNVTAILSDSSLFASKVEFDQVKQTLNEISPPYISLSQISGKLPDEDQQLQNTAIIKEGAYAECRTSIGVSDDLSGIKSAEGCAMAYIPVESGEKYTVFFPGVTQAEVLLNTLAKRTHRNLFLGFVVFGKNGNLDVTSADVQEIFEWIDTSDVMLNGFDSCTEIGAANPDKVNSGYYFSFVVPEGADSLVFNVALTTKSGAAKQYDYRDSFLFFKGLYSELPEGLAPHIHRLGNYMLMDMEARAGLIALEKKKSEDISRSFITYHIENPIIDTESIFVFKQGNIISGNMTFKGQFDEASGDDMQWTINNLYKPKGGTVVAQVLLIDSNGVTQSSEKFIAYINDNTLYLEAISYGYNLATISFCYICESEV